VTSLESSPPTHIFSGISVRIQAAPEPLDKDVVFETPLDIPPLPPSCESSKEGYQGFQGGTVSLPVLAHFSITGDTRVGQ